MDHPTTRPLSTQNNHFHRNPQTALCPVCRHEHEQPISGPDQIAPCAACIVELEWLFTDQARLTPQPGEVLVTIPITGDDPLFPATITDERWNGFAIPAFRREVAEAVVAWTNHHYRLDPQDAAYGYWDRETVVLTYGHWADEPDCRPDHVTADADGRYPIGACNWTWDVATDADLDRPHPCSLDQAGVSAPDDRPQPAHPLEAELDGVGTLEEVLDGLDGEGDMAYDCTVEGTRHDNTRRAGFAATALLAYARRTGHLGDANDEAPRTVLGDLLGDLRHLTDLLALDYDEVDRRGLEHYTEELHGR